jgi:hypothetical protein
VHSAHSERRTDARTGEPQRAQDRELARPDVDRHAVGTLQPEAGERRLCQFLSALIR